VCFGKKIPVKEIIENEVYSFFAERLPYLDKQYIHIIHESTNYTKNFAWFNPNSTEDLPEYDKRFANDTSSVVGHWPLTTAEYMALRLEGHFYQKDNSPTYSFCGQDIKVMIVRSHLDYNITMCVPFIADRVADKQDYFTKKSKVNSSLKSLAKKIVAEQGGSINLNLNTQDSMMEDFSNPKKLYFVAAGSSIDFGEEGVVGRGNARSGVISSTRHYSMEAAWGKNPHYHVGKVLGYAADEIAKKIANEYDSEIRIWITTKMGDPLFEPNFLSVDTSRNIDNQELRTLVVSELQGRDWSKELIYDEPLVPKPLIE
jgi:S-adenosylmethionine synthetase